MKITKAELTLRKDRIIHEAFRLFCRDGIDNASIKDVARLSDVGEKSVYRYFNSKTDLVMATITVLWKEVVTELISSLQEGYEELDGLHQIGCLLDGMRHLFEHHATYVFFSYESRIFLSRHGAKMAEAVYANELRPIQTLYYSALRKGMADGSIAQRDDVEDLYVSIWGLMRGYVAKVVIYDRMYDGENMWRDHFPSSCALLLSALAHGDLPSDLPIVPAMV